MRDNIIPLQKYEKWQFAVGKKKWEFTGCASKQLIWQITGVVPEELIVFNAVGLSFANLRFPRALINERVEFKPVWPTFQGSFQALSTDRDTRNTPRSVWRASHRTGFFIFTIPFSLSFECFFMPTRNTLKIKSLTLCFRSLQTLLSLLVLVLKTLIGSNDLSLNSLFLSCTVIGQFCLSGPS